MKNVENVLFMWRLMRVEISLVLCELSRSKLKRFPYVIALIRLGVHGLGRIIIIIIIIIKELDEGVAAA